MPMVNGKHHCRACDVIGEMDVRLQTLEAYLLGLTEADRITADIELRKWFKNVMCHA